jgi:hypothetical protein
MELVTATKIEPLGKKATSLYEKIVEGYRISLTPGSKRKDGTGLVFQPYDMLCISNQYFLDAQPSCCFFPILSFTEMLNWNGEEYEAIFMGSNAKVVQKVGATDGDLLECSGDDKRVQTAFTGFQDAALAMVGLLKSYNSRGKYDSVHYDSDDYLLSSSLGEYLESTPAFRVPSLKNKNTADFKYRIVKFSRAKALGDPADGEGHPAPVPLLLVAKSINAWISHLLREDLLDGFTGNKGGAKHCSFFPFCEVDGFDASCPVCLARMMMRGDPALASLDYFEGDDEHAQRIAACQEIVETVESDPLLKRAAGILRQVRLAAFCCLHCASHQVTTHRAPHDRGIAPIALIDELCCWMGCQPGAYYAPSIDGRCALVSPHAARRWHTGGER